MKHAVVTGADRGLGFALTEQLLAAGYTVFAGRYLEQWEGLDRLRDEAGERLVPVALDIGSEESVRRAAETVAARTGSIDLLVNNAGIAGHQDDNIFGEIDYEAIRRMYEVNALGPLRMAQAFQAQLLAGGDKLVVNVSSEAGQINQTWREGWYGYCMSKAALNIQSNILHNQLRAHGGKVLVVHPGWMKSYMSGELNEDAAITTAEAAAGILRVIGAYLADGDAAARPHPAFRDYSGAEMSWT
ncbi:SDR family NAD(P)-dependent oxidoreductase [Cohnella ginsengisoli]|uniref:SDR family NAD(P)-dependent oxidoreductase n=1 Tax=Cohnella ginsengisoli TaxID=425004 RepID=A0A9X4KJK1_9BACL|nr:SDR family NAD(P)-dependent oxidoreductase [Cohnella ginsengisoli]MDG0792639.1 SDR family NAD(P)-dependent oxidoreductase [Cohnella ginsengisoli]